MSESLIPLERIERAILLIRSQKVVLPLNVPGNDQSLRRQSGTLKRGRGQHSKYRHYVFTEQGVAMLSSVLYSDRAIEVMGPPSAAQKKQQIGFRPD